MEQIFKNNKPILIAGATASGKSELGIKLAQKYNGVIINADALQIYKQWKILSARPDDIEITKCPHSLYGHINIGNKYSSGHWLKDVKLELNKAHDDGLRPILLGGTGLYFQLLLNGIADVPVISDKVKSEADKIEQSEGKQEFSKILQDLDKKIIKRIDIKNPVRTRRAWEVITETGKSLADWQDETPAPIINFDDCIPLNLICDTVWLNNRIDKRFEIMIKNGAIEECKKVLELGLWEENHPSCKAIGAKELISHIVNGDDIKIAIQEAKTQTRQYAKRQRTWFRSKMKKWLKIEASEIQHNIQ